MASKEKKMVFVPCKSITKTYVFDKEVDELPPHATFLAGIKSSYINLKEGEDMEGEDDRSSQMEKQVLNNTMVVTSGTNSINKEIKIRRRMASIFNKREEDFPSLGEYNDYLEEVEDMTLNLIEGVDICAIEARISQYKKENVEQINEARRG